MHDAPDLNEPDWAHGVALPAFRAAAPPLGRQARLDLLTQAADTLARHYAHLPQKRLTRHIDPVARLRALHDELAATQEGDLPDALTFHTQVSHIFAGLHDLHTLYTLPPYFAACVASLPFTAALIGGPAPQIVVTAVLPAVRNPHFHPGVELLTWNGAPIAEVLQACAAVSGGANPPAARARAVQMLTQRPLLRMPPPAEDQVRLGFRAAPGAALHHITLDWRVSVAPAATPPASLAHALHTSLDGEGDALHRHRRHHYGPHAGRLHAARVAPGHPFQAELPSPLAEVQAWAGAAAGRRFGVLRIQTFKTESDDVFIAGIRALLAALPQEGLILDVRDNPGGLVAAAERLLQCFSDAPIRPVNVAFLATEANLALCEANTPGPERAAVPLDLSPWVAPLRQALARGAPWSAALPMTAPSCFGPGRRGYGGPVLLLTSACCYSACDIFIAGFRDNALGRILGVDDNIGAGGANVWTRRQIELLRTGRPALLPGEADLHVAARRVFRADAAATPLEELGVVPDVVHHRTRRDALEHDVELFGVAEGLLKQEVLF
jgi:hypothetical protein